MNIVLFNFTLLKLNGVSFWVGIVLYLIGLIGLISALITYSKLRSFDNAHKKDRKLYKALTDIEKYKKSYELYKEGYTMMQEEYDSYIKAEKVLKDNGFISPEEIDVLKAEKVKLYEQRDMIMKDIKFHKNEKRICNNIQKTQDYIAERARLIEQQHAVSQKKGKKRKR